MQVQWHQRPGDNSDKSSLSPVWHGGLVFPKSQKSRGQGRGRDWVGVVGEIHPQKERLLALRVVSWVRDWAANKMFKLQAFVFLLYFFFFPFWTYILTLNSKLPLSCRVHSWRVNLNYKKKKKSFKKSFFFFLLKATQSTVCMVKNTV